MPRHKRAPRKKASDEDDIYALLRSAARRGVRHMLDIEQPDRRAPKSLVAFATIAPIGHDGAQMGSLIAVYWRRLQL